MKPDEIDRILGSEEPIVASSGFTASVMQAIRMEATAPTPIAFPWKKALPGIGVAAIAVTAVLVVAVIAILRPEAQVSSPADSAILRAVVHYFASPTGTWLGVGGFLSIASLVFGLRLAFPRS